MVKKEALELDDFRTTWTVTALSLGLPLCKMGWWEVPITTASPQTSQLSFRDHCATVWTEINWRRLFPHLSSLPSSSPRFYTVLKYQPNEYI